MKYIFIVLFLAGLLFVEVMQNHAIGAESFVINRHSTDKNLTTKPALFQYTDPSSGDSSKLIDISIAYAFSKENSNKEFSFAIELHQNTLTDKEQDTLSFKANMFTDFVSKDCKKNGQESTYCAEQLFGTYSLSFQQDLVKNTESIIFINEYVGQYPALKINSLLNENNRWNWSPIAGIELEEVIKAEEDREGFVGRLYLGSDLNLKPFIGKNSKKLIITLSYRHWENFGKDERLAIVKDSHNLKTVKVSYPLAKSKNFTLSLELARFDGENPREKKEKQVYNQVALGFKGKF